MDDSNKVKPGLSDGDIETHHGLNRRRLLRGFGLGTVVGVTGLGLSGCVTTPSTGFGGVTDSDNGPITDPAGGGRGGRRASPTGITDSDNGPITDAGGYGRGGGGGYVSRASGYTDSDNGPITDAGGNGRGPSRGARTGFTDSDNGPIVDAGGFGRGPRR